MKKVAIVGVEGSGKTVMLAGLGELYSHPDDQGYFMAPKNFATASYVADKILKMRGGAWPSATAEDAMQGLDWTLKQKSSAGARPVDVCEISCLDFAGEVYRSAFGIESENGEEAQSAEVESLKSYIRKASDLVILINLRDVISMGLREKRVQESMWITNAILSYAMDTTGGRKEPRATIVLSQADSYADTIRACGGAKGVLAKYLPHVANNYDWLDVLAVSAVDKTVVNDEGDVVPAPDFQPTELRMVMDWIVGGLSQSPWAERMRSSQTKPASAPIKRNDSFVDAGQGMGCLRAYFTCFQKYGVCEGRACRSEFWKFTLLHLGVTLIAFVCCGIAADSSANEEIFCIPVLYFVAGIIPLWTAARW